jgi:hypothetical protein
MVSQLIGQTMKCQLPLELPVLKKLLDQRELNLVELLLKK